MKQERLYQVLVAPHISEKATNVADATNSVVFKVAVSANKLEVKKAVEKLFNVKVEAVRLLNVKGKMKQNRFGLSRRNNWKKAYVRLAAGHDIDFASVG
jgi:large subunit ribosomal protein L23